MKQVCIFVKIYCNYSWLNTRTCPRKFHIVIYINLNVAEFLQKAVLYCKCHAVDICRRANDEVPVPGEFSTEEDIIDTQKKWISVALRTESDSAAPNSKINGKYMLPQ